MTGHFLLSGETHVLTASFPLASLLDFTLGLDFKEMRIRLDNNPEAIVYQSTKDRLSYAWKSQLYLDAGWRRRWAMRQKLLRRFYRVDSRPVVGLMEAGD